MIHFSTGNGKYLAVNVPTNCSDISIYTNEDKSQTLDYYNNDVLAELQPWEGVDIPTGNYTIIGRASELTDEQCKYIVEDVGKDTFGATCYDDYECREWVLGRCYSNPIASFNSLLRANSIPPNYLIIKID